VTLLAQIDDPMLVRPLLSSSRIEVAQAAAEALVAAPEALEDVVGAASKNSAIFRPAVAALRRHQPTAVGFQVAAREADPAVRETYLRHVDRAEFLGAPGERQERLDLAMLLVRTRLQLRNPQGALAVIESLPGTEAGRFAAPRATALLWLNRIDDAEQLTKESALAASCWLDALEYAQDLEHARTIRDRLAARFAAAFTPAEAARFESLSDGVEGPPDPGAGGAAEDPARSPPDDEAGNGDGDAGPSAGVV
jgi:hypothetical protein